VYFTRSRGNQLSSPMDQGVTGALWGLCLGASQPPVYRNYLPGRVNIVSVKELILRDQVDTTVWLCDQSSCHRKFDEHALQARSILVKDGGPRRVHDTVWGRRPHSMVNEDATAKGLRTICVSAVSPQRGCWLMTCRLCY
jgi:hypothetical protein